MKSPSTRALIAAAGMFAAAGLLPQAIASSQPHGAVTVLSDIVGARGAYTPIIETFMVEDPVESTAFFQSGVLAGGDPRIQAILAAASPVAAVPFWNPIDSNIEPNYSNDVYEDIAVPRNVTTGLQMGRIAFLNEGFGSMDLVKAITKKDPLAYVASVIDNFWARQAEKRLIATALGIYNDNIGVTDAFHTQNDMVTDAAGPFSADAWIDAQAQLGDKLGVYGVAAMHRLVYTQMQKAQLIDFVTDDVQKVQIPYYQGSRIVVDNGMPLFGASGSRKSLVIFFGAGAIGYATETPSEGLEYERAASRGNGGGVDVMWTRRNYIMHPLGYSFLSTTITGNGTETRPASASWADLALATNWNRVIAREHVPMAFMTVSVAG